MKIIITCMLLISAIFAEADPNISAFDHWDLVALVNVTNGNVTTTILHLLPNTFDEKDVNDFHKGVVKWAIHLKDQSFVYAMCIQNGRKKSATWEISLKTYEEMKKISLIMTKAELGNEHMNPRANQSLVPEKAPG